MLHEEIVYLLASIAARVVHLCHSCISLLYPDFTVLCLDALIMEVIQYREFLFNYHIVGTPAALRQNVGTLICDCTRGVIATASPRISVGNDV